MVHVARGGCDMRGDRRAALDSRVEVELQLSVVGEEYERHARARRPDRKSLDQLDDEVLHCLVVGARRHLITHSTRLSAKITAHSAFVATGQPTTLNKTSPKNMLSMSMLKIQMV